jgi:hypothetical protein
MQMAAPASSAAALHGVNIGHAHGVPMLAPTPAMPALHGTYAPPYVAANPVVKHVPPTQPLLTPSMAHDPPSGSCQLDRYSSGSERSSEQGARQPGGAAEAEAEGDGEGDGEGEGGGTLQVWDKKYKHNVAERVRLLCSLHHPPARPYLPSSSARLGPCHARLTPPALYS